MHSPDRCVLLVLSPQPVAGDAERLASLINGRF
jgi:hypothetical protein